MRKRSWPTKENRRQGRSWKGIKRKSPCSRGMRSDLRCRIKPDPVLYASVFDDGERRFIRSAHASHVRSAGRVAPSCDPCIPARAAPDIAPASRHIAKATANNPVFMVMSSLFRFLLLPLRHSKFRFLTRRTRIPGGASGKIDDCSCIGEPMTGRWIRLDGAGSVCSM